MGARHGLRALYGIHRDDIRHPKIGIPRSTHSKMSLFAAMAALMCAVIPALSADNKSNGYTDRPSSLVERRAGGTSHRGLVRVATD